jgi:hypothetical protein
MVGPLRRVGMVGPLRRDLRPMSRTPDRRAGTERRQNGACAQSGVIGAHLTREDASKSNRARAYNNFKNT